MSAKVKASKVKVDDQAWAKLRLKLIRMGATKAHVKVGILGDATHTGPSGEEMSLVEIAATHEFGSSDGRVPERSFIRAGVAEDQDGLTRTLNTVAKGIVSDRFTIEEGLGLLGLWAQNAVKKRIVSTDIPPPLKPQTIARKGSSKPLVDTGQLLNAISFEVVRP